MRFSPKSEVHLHTHRLATGNALSLNDLLPDDMNVNTIPA